MSQIPALHTPRFGGTVFIKTNPQAGDHESAIQDAVWDAVRGDTYGFSKDDKSRLLSEDSAITRTTPHNSRPEANIFYVSAENDDALATLGTKLAAITGHSVIHRPGTVEPGGGETNRGRAVELAQKWEAVANEKLLNTVG